MQGYYLIRKDERVYIFPNVFVWIRDRNSNSIASRFKFDTLTITPQFPVILVLYNKIKKMMDSFFEHLRTM